MEQAHIDRITKEREARQQQQAQQQPDQECGAIPAHHYLYASRKTPETSTQFRSAYKA
jgi:hypothetical protein